MGWAPYLGRAHTHCGGRRSGAAGAPEAAGQHPVDIKIHPKFKLSQLEQIREDPGFLAPRGASWMAGDGFKRLDLIGGRTTAN